MLSVTYQWTSEVFWRIFEEFKYKKQCQNEINFIQNELIILAKGFGGLVRMTFWLGHQLVLFAGDALIIYRAWGYYTVARRYEFYVQVARTILFLPREHKIHIFEPMCNVLFIIWRNQLNKSKSKRQESWRHWTIRHSKLTYGKYATRVPDEVAHGIYEWFSSQ